MQRRGTGTGGADAESPQGILSLPGLIHDCPLWLRDGPADEQTFIPLRDQCHITLRARIRRRGMAEDRKADQAAKRFWANTARACAAVFSRFCPTNAESSDQCLANVKSSCRWAAVMACSASSSRRFAVVAPLDLRELVSGRQLSDNVADFTLSLLRRRRRFHKQLAQLHENLQSLLRRGELWPLVLRLVPTRKK